MAARPAPSSSSRRGRTGDLAVGSFRIGNEIGKGSFATVYKGHHADGSLVAIKSVNLSKLNKKLKDNLYSEIDILKGLQHPHIVALIDCRESTTHIHLVTEICELGDLSMFIKKREKHHTNPATADMARKYPSTAAGLNEVIVRSFLKQLASALKFLRDRNFIHRDIKPQNVLLSPSIHFLRTLEDAPKILSASATSLIPNAGVESLPMLKIADFGFARALPTGGMADTLCGSPLYMAPEILRYEKYDAKADLWSVGTVLYEMMTGKPPFRASNHVELLRKIEQADDVIKFPKEAVVTSAMKHVIRGLLKRSPVERIPFADFFSHQVIIEVIPGLVEVDIPRERQPPVRRSTLDPERSSRLPSSPIGRPSSSLANELLRSPEAPLRPVSEVERYRTPDDHTRRRPSLAPAANALEKVQTVQKRSSLQSRPVRDSPSSSLMKEQSSRERFSQRKSAQEQAAQDVADEREYVVVHKGAVFANSLADELAADPRFASGTGRNQQTSSRPVRRDRSNTVPTSEPVSKAVQIVRNPAAPVHQRQSSYERRYGPSPNSAATALSKAIHGASVRLYGVGVNLLKGQSPPPLYSPFPSFTNPKGNVGLIEDKPSTEPDDDHKAVSDIEELATISDVVFCFANVKFAQLVPLAPSMEYGLGGPNSKGKPAKANSGEQIQDDDGDQDEGLSADATATVCEEALVLYVKVLTILAKCLEIAGAWWERKGRGAIHTSAQSSQSDAATHRHGVRINSIVQWVRSRFNESLEKAEFIRMKLLEAQKKLPEDHPGHPQNHEEASRSAAASTDGVHLSSGVTAEKILYERATEMCRHAAVDEIANEDLLECERSYKTSLRLLQAVLEGDDGIPSAGKSIGAQRGENEGKTEEDRSVNLDMADRQIVEKMVVMIRKRTNALQKKIAIIAKHQGLPHASPRSTHSSGGTPTIISTPPK